jgi:uncharacterized membrane protein (DUF485 family)
MPKTTHKPARVERADWKRLAATPEFSALLRRKKAFIVPATVFFVIYYFALPVLVGYFPDFMNRKVLGALNIAYLFALSQFVMAWVLAWLYVRAAGRFDKLADDVKRTGERP